MSYVLEFWEALGDEYPTLSGKGTTHKVFDVLAPYNSLSKIRHPIYEMGGESTPTPEEVWTLAETIAVAVNTPEDEWDDTSVLCILKSFEADDKETWCLSKDEARTVGAFKNASYALLYQSAFLPESGAYKICSKCAFAIHDIIFHRDFH